MKNPTTLPRWGKWAVGSCLMTIALAATSLSLAINVYYGLQISWAAGVASGLSDLSLVFIPVIAAVIGWSIHMRLAVLICALFSIWCAVNYAADTQGARLLTLTDQASRYEDVLHETKRLKADLSALSETASPLGLKSLAKAALEAAEREGQRGGCGIKCEALKAKATALEARYAESSKKAGIEARLAVLRSKRETKVPVDTSGLATLVTSFTRYDKDQTSKATAVFSIILILILVELLRHLNGAAARMLGALRASGEDVSLRAISSPFRRFISARVSIPGCGVGE